MGWGVEIAKQKSRELSFKHFFFKCAPFGKVARSISSLSAFSL